MMMHEIEFESEFREKLYNLLALNGKLSRKELCILLDKPRTTVYDNLERLMKADLVERKSKNNGKRGRPIVFWKIKKGEDT